MSFRIFFFVFLLFKDEDDKTLRATNLKTREADDEEFPLFSQQKL